VVQEKLVSIVLKTQRPDPDGSLVSPRATVAALLVTACFAGCATPLANAWVFATAMSFISSMKMSI
jgi:hypothetical protein